MTFFTYEGDGRVPFDPTITARRLDGCLLCHGRSIAIVGVFIPATDEMRAVLLRLRRHAQPTKSTSALTYGLCADCVDLDDVTARVECAIEAAAAKVVLQ
jgi:hypothetical protein